MGAVLEYGVVWALGLGPGPVACGAAVWLRELGFVAFYASLILKIYRNLMEYRSVAFRPPSTLRIFESSDV